MCSNRSEAGPTGQPACQLDASSAADTVAMMPEYVGTAVVVGAGTAVGGAVVGRTVVVVVVVDAVVDVALTVEVERAADVVAARFGVEEHATNESTNVTPTVRRARGGSTAS